MSQMRENLSLFSFWGLIFAVTALTFFVVVHAYKNRTAIGVKNDIVTTCAGTELPSISAQRHPRIYHINFETRVMK